MRHQRQAMRFLFESRPNEWIPLPEVLALAAQYNARIKELRDNEVNPMNIINKKERVNGVWHSWFMYVKPEPIRIQEEEQQLSFAALSV